MFDPDSLPRILLRRRIVRLPLAALLSLVVAGCAATRVSETPTAVRDWNSIKPLSGEVVYSGNPEYLPRMISAKKPDAGAPSRIVFRYSHDVSYDVPKEHALTVFNPLLVFGASTATDSVVVKGVLEIVKDGAVLKRYEKTVVLGKDKTVFADGATLSDMRKQGLLLLRDHIDDQLIADREFLREQLNTPAQKGQTIRSTRKRSTHETV